MPGVVRSCRCRAAYAIADVAAACTFTVMLARPGGISWQHNANLASRSGLAILGLLLLTCAVGWLLYRTRQVRDRPGAKSDKCPTTQGPDRPTAARFPRQVAWVGRRLDSSCSRGLTLTCIFAAAAACVWTFAGLTHDVVTHDGLAVADPSVHAWVLGHRAGWLTVVMRTGTWVGSNVVLLPVLVVSAALLRRSRHSWRPGAQVALVYGAAVLGHVLVAAAVHRARPPAADWLATPTGSSYPSGHTMQITALCGAMILALYPVASRRFRVAATGVAVTAVILVGTSRVYLGVHWMTDVLGGLALSSALVCVVAATGLLTRHDGDPNRGSSQRLRHDGSRRSQRPPRATHTTR